MGIGSGFNRLLAKIGAVASDMDRSGPAVVVMNTVGGGS